MTAPLVAAVLSVAVLLAWWRLAWWRRTAAPESRSPMWRLGMLILGQPIVAGLLFLTVFPPMLAVPGRGTLTVATRGTALQTLLAPGADIVALPEAAVPANMIAAPDLATALRRRPGVVRLRVLGEGLAARDIDAARGLAITFDPSRLPRGLIALAAPEPVAPGGDFHVGGEAFGMSGTAELLDPGGAHVAVTQIDADGRFVLTGAARPPGQALFRVRLRDARGATVEEAAVPVVTVADPPVRVLFLAGAPGPEVKYWRRWAIDAGLTVATRQAVGAGLELGDRVPSLGAAMLARYDLVIVDERSWVALAPGERTALISSVRGGLGLLLRVTGPLPAPVRTAWASLGLPLSDGAATASVRPSAAGEPELTRRALPFSAPQFVPVLHDSANTVLAGWRAVGRGRVGVWSVTDDFALVTSGHGERFGALWGAVVGAVARARAISPTRVEGLPQVDRRTSICGIGKDAVVFGPDRRAISLLPDAAARGCAGFWPRSAGWHVVKQVTPLAFYVYPSMALPGVRAAERRDATLSLTGDTGATVPSEREARPSPSWPWLMAFVLVAAGLWWLERFRPHGRAPAR